MYSDRSLMFLFFSFKCKYILEYCKIHKNLSRSLLRKFLFLPFIYIYNIRDEFFFLLSFFFFYHIEIFVIHSFFHLIYREINVLVSKHNTVFQYQYICMRLYTSNNICLLLLETLRRRI